MASEKVASGEYMKLKRITPERLDLIIEALLTRHFYPTITHTAIAKELGIPRPTIIRWLSRYYVDIPKYGNLIFGVKMAKTAKLGCPHNAGII